MARTRAILPRFGLQRAALAALAIGVLCYAPTLFALEAQVPSLVVADGWLDAVLEMSDAFTPALRQKLGAGSLYLRVEAKLWEDRPLWDRQVGGTAVSVFRLVRNPSGRQVAVIDSQGRLTAYPDYPPSFEVRIRVVGEDAIAPDGHYYVEAETALGSVDEREVDETGRALFGSDEVGGMGRIGRFLLSTVLQVTDYMQGSSAHARSRTFDAAEIKGA
jgi:hypothetical protein